MRWVCFCAVLLLGEQAALAEVRLDYVYPAGGRPDSVFEVEVGGELSEIVSATFGGEGVRATLLGACKDIVYTKKGKAVLKPVPNRYRFQITVDKDAKPGLRALRVGTLTRLSDPLSFEIADLPETTEAFTNRAVASRVAIDRLPICLNGRVRGTGADVYRFRAAKGASVVAFTEAAVLPRGAFRPVLGFTDVQGKPCEGVAVFDAEAAPVAVLEAPETGEYALTVSGASGQGGDGAVYRIRLGELPLITGFSPMGAKAGESLNVRLAGFNLSQKRIRLFTGGKDEALCLATIVGDACVRPSLHFDLQEEPDVDETEPNNSPETAEPVALPCVVNGDLEAAGGRDLYRIDGKKGVPVFVDVRAEALGSPLRPCVTIRNVRGQTVVSGAFDTNATLRAAVCGRDPTVVLTPTEDGPYTVEIADVDGRSGADFLYRMRLGPPRPDFRLWMTSPTVNIPADGSVPVTLHVDRLHGFDGEIRVGLDFPPLSIASEGGVIPAGATTLRMTVSTDGVRYPRTVFGLSLTGYAMIGGSEVRRLAVPVSPVRDAQGRPALLKTFGDAAAKVGVGVRALRIDQLGKTGPVDVRYPAPTAFRDPVLVSAKTPVRLTVLSATLATNLGGLYVPTVVWPPNGFIAAGVQPSNRQERAGVLLRADPAAMKPGQTGFFILGCYAKGDTNRTPVAVAQSVPYVIKP